LNSLVGFALHREFLRGKQLSSLVTGLGDFRSLAFLLLNLAFARLGCSGTCFGSRPPRTTACNSFLPSV
jgi:hypothetical protein